MTPEEVAAKVERLDEDLAELRQELAVERRVFSHWAISVAVGHLLVSLGLWLGIIANSNKMNEEFLWIFMMSAIVTLVTGVSILVSLASTRGLRAWLRSGKKKQNDSADTSGSGQ